MALAWLAAVPKLDAWNAIPKPHAVSAKPTLITFPKENAKHVQA